MAVVHNNGPQQPQDECHCGEQFVFVLLPGNPSVHLDLKWSEDETMLYNSALSQSTFYTLASSMFMNDDMSERPFIPWSFRIKCIR